MVNALLESPGGVVFSAFSRLDNRVVLAGSHKWGVFGVIHCASSDPKLPSVRFCFDLRSEVAFDHWLYTIIEQPGIVELLLGMAKEITDLQASKDQRGCAKSRGLACGSSHYHRANPQMPNRS